jgi:hypothetical protein
MMRAKGFDVADRPLRRLMVEHARRALMRLEARGKVRKVMVEPEAWSELAGQT